MKLYHSTRFLLGLYLLFLLLFLIYSFTLIDPNLTLLNNGIWTQFRNSMVSFGYGQRDLSAKVYIAFVLLFFALHFYFVKNYKKIKFVHLFVSLVFIGIFSYPFLSHDFFNYLFDAKIITFYHQNPYFHKPLDFSNDPWLRFMHSIHRTYPYGPVFLGLSLIPSFLSLGKILLDFIFFKIFFLAFFIYAIYLFFKLDKKWAIFIATNPLVIVEGLVNSHNDFLALSLGMIGAYLMLKNKKFLGYFNFLLSTGIKYITFPYLALSKNKKLFNKLSLFSLFAVMIYFSFWQEIQPWYFLAFLAFVPFFEEFITKLNLFFAGLLFSYYPYVLHTGWDEPGSVLLKHQIIMAFFVLNLLYLGYSYWRPSK